MGRRQPRQPGLVRGQPRYPRKRQEASPLTRHDAQDRSRGTRKPIAWKPPGAAPQPRDLVIQLTWENSNGPAELEMKVKEPSGSFCTLEQKQSPGGGVMIGCNLTDKEPNCQYIAAQAFDGAYEITIARVFGQTLGNRARLSIIA